MLPEETVSSQNRRLNQRDFINLATYTVILALIMVLLHEVFHVLTALMQGVHFSSLEIGFWGINPSVTLPSGLAESIMKPIFYAGGIGTGVVLLGFYFIYWVRKFRASPSRLNWAMALVALVFSAEQLATGYLEGRYHMAYLYGATTLFSPTHLFTVSFMVLAVLAHLYLCPRERFKTVRG